MFNKSKVRKSAEHLVSFADKVYNYRRDLMPQEAVTELERLRDKLVMALNEKADDDALLHRIDELDELLQKYGGHIYPQKFIPDNIETILVAAILAIGVRTYFLQPFKIPTNSMYPTYNGMTADVFNERNPRPGVVGSLARKVLLWTTTYDVKAPTTGEVMLPLVARGQGNGGISYYLAYSNDGSNKVYTALVSDELRTSQVSMSIPMDFSLEERVLTQIFFPQCETFYDAMRYAQQNGLILQTPNGTFLRTNKHVKAGEPIFDFDILTGDMLFVDRMSYHFVRPKVGDPIVFRTDDIPNIKGDFYYIKRLVGEPGDRLQVDPPMLIRNEKPIEGADAFRKNAEQEGNYPGYSFLRSMSKGVAITVPEKMFFAMGDNSPNSSDSRDWGPVPEKSVIGRAFCIYYPFTERWGFAK